MANIFEDNGIIEVLAGILMDNMLFSDYNTAISFLSVLTEDEQKGLFAIVSQNFAIMDFAQAVRQFIRTRIDQNILLKLFLLKYNSFALSLKI